MNFTVPNIILYSLEFTAAFAGSYYLKRTNDSLCRPFVYYLWIVTFVEILALYTFLVHSDTTNSILLTIRNSPFRSNFWLYNVFGLVLFNFVGQFYYRLMVSTTSKKIVMFIILGFNIGYVLYFILTKDMFTSQPYLILVKTFLFFIMTLLYYRQLLLSSEIIYFYRETAFYIVTGLILWHISVTPIVLFMDFYKAINPNFVEFRVLYLLAVNFILYSCITFGFLYTLRFKEK